MDWARLILLVEALVVGLMFTRSTWRMARAWRIHGATNVGASIAAGRICRYLCVVFFCTGMVMGQVELWGTPLSPRIFPVQVGLLLGGIGWALVDRAFPDEQMFEYSLLRKRDIGER